MHEGQKQFYDFILDRTQEEKKADMETLLKEGFIHQDNGTFTPAYLADYTPRMLAMLKPEHLAEVKAVTEQFGPAHTSE